MATRLRHGLPDTLKEVRTRPLFMMRLDVRPLQIVGATPGAHRRVEKEEAVDPAEYYFRIAPFFETAAPRYAWLNNVLATGIGHRGADGPVYSIFEIL